MGSNKNKKKQDTSQQRQPTQPTQTQPAGYRSPVPADSDIFNPSGNDPRGRVQNRILDESSRYRSQIDPYINDLGRNWGDSLGQSNQDYGDIMSRYQNVASGGNQITPQSISYTDPFTSYGDYQGFSKSGGYSPSDIADLRSRGVAPIRAAYSNAEREVGRQRSLQGGYSPNATATLAKMAREQSQSGADALQNVNAGIVDSRNRNQLAGMAGMAGIEGQRLGAQIDTGKFNANANMFAQQQNIGNQMDALRGMNSLYGTTPGRANMFGQQLGNAINNSGQMGSSYFEGENNAQIRPGAFQNTMDKVNTGIDIYNTAGKLGVPIYQAKTGQRQQPVYSGGPNAGIGPSGMDQGPSLGPGMPPYVPEDTSDWYPGVWDPKKYQQQG